MTQYYKDIMRASQWIETQWKAAKKDGTTIEAEILAYEATKRFPVGEKALFKRMKKMKEIDNAPIDFIE